MAIHIVQIWFVFMAFVLGFVLIGEISWWIFLRLFKTFDDYINS